MRTEQSRASSCATCRFWDEAAHGLCRRRAPVTADQPDRVAHWPSTEAGQRCGDGVERAAEAKERVSCGRCVFWHPNPAGGLDPQDRRDERADWWREAGHCLRHAPLPGSDPGCRGFWRATHVTDGCGEGETAQVEPAIAGS